MEHSPLSIQSEELKRRVSAIFGHAEKVEKLFIMNTEHSDPNFLYLTGFTSGLFESSYLIVEKTGATLFTSALEYDTAVAQAPDILKVVKMDLEGTFREQVKKLITGLNVGINGDFIPYAVFAAIKKKYKPKKLFDVSDALLEARLIKSREEIDLIRKAVGITKLALVLIQKEFKEGMTELDLASKFDAASSSLGSEGPSFKTIVCFGENASQPHHSPDHTKLQYGDFILIDAGARVGNYCSDMTRTFIFGDDKEKVPEYVRKEAVMRIVKEAQLKALRKVKPGVTGASIHRVAQSVIDTAADGLYAGTFIHALGHSLGIEVHDGAGFSPGAKQKLKPGMVITAEPGIYINGFGGVRIEDDILVTDKGFEVL